VTLASDHATVYAGVLATDGVQEAVLLSTVSPRTAVKAIYAVLHPTLDMSGPVAAQLNRLGSPKPIQEVKQLNLHTTE
jgi:hypothetical protein